MSQDRKEENHYKILGISQTATESEIKKAYRKLALIQHPDKPEGSTEKFKQLTNSYEILLDPQQREAYDATLIQASTTPQPREYKRAKTTMKRSTPPPQPTQDTFYSAPPPSAPKSQPPEPPKKTVPPKSDKEYYANYFDAMRDVAAIFNADRGLKYVIGGKSAAVLLGVVFEMKERPTEVDIVINNINEAIEKLKLAASQNKERFKLEVKAQGQGQAQLSFIAPPHEIPVLINLHYDESKELEAKKAKVEDMYCYSPQKIFLTYTERGYLDETTEFILQEIVKKHPEHLLPAKYPLEQTPLHYALKADYLGAAEELILHGASITQADATGRKPIDYTSDASFREFLQMAEDKQYNAAHIAAINGRTDVIPYLAKQNLLNAFDKNGFTPAHLAISKNNLNMLQKLTESKAIISPTKKGMSPLAIAIQQNNAPIVDFLIKNGESVTVTTSKGEEPLYKFAKPNSETFNLLKEAYAKGATRSKEFKKNG